METGCGGDAQMCTPSSLPGKLISSPCPPPQTVRSGDRHNESERGMHDGLDGRAATRPGTDRYQIWAECLHPFLICSGWF